MGIIAWYENVETENDLLQLQQKELLNISLAALELNRNLEAIKLDLVYLSNNLLFRDVLDHVSQQKLNSLETEFRVFSDSKDIYDQIRWIDETGQEKLRIDYENGNAVIIADKKLQDKSQRYYFSKSMKLRAGDIYFSPLDLNVEHGEIEEPFKPTIRVATRVANSKGQERGILIFNYLAAHMLDNFSKVTPDIADHVSLLNRDGYWLKSPVNSDEWGFMFDRPELSFNARHPQVWSHILNETLGKIERPEGLFTWSTIYPVALEKSGFKTQNKDLNIDSGKIEQHRYFWKLLSFLPRADIEEFFLPLRQRLILMGTIFLMLSAYGVWKLVRAFEAQAQSEHELLQSYINLEQTVAVRTRELNESKQRLQSLIDTTWDWIWEFDTDANFTYVNPGVKNLLGYSPEELIGKSAFDLMPVKEAEKLSSQFAGFVEKKKPFFGLQNVNLHADGHRVILESNGMPFFDEEGNLLGYRGIDRNITESKKLEDELKASEQRFRDVALISADWIWEIDENGVYTFASEGVYPLLGYQPDEILGQTPFDLMAPDESVRVASEFGKIVDSRSTFKDFENTVIGKDGQVHIALTSGKPVYDADGEFRGYRGVDRDITRQKEMENKVRELAFHDALTKLPNRRLCFDRLNQSITSSKRSGRYGALLFMDLDNFKPVNDLYGHDAGDLLLIEVSSRLKNCIREVDTVGRFGGDEFVVILNALENERTDAINQARKVAQKIAKVISKPYQLETKKGKNTEYVEHYCSFSIGVTLFLDSASPDEIIKRADTAMYEAKNIGKNTIHFSSQA